MWPPNEQFFGHRAEVDRWSVTEAVTGHPVLRYYRATLDCSPMQVHDVPARFADHRVVGAWLEIGSSWGTPSQVAVPLHFGPNDHRSFVLGRVDPFSPGELELIGVLQRLLVGIDRQVTALRGAAHPAHAWAAAESARLTVRELTVLEQVASGLTAAAAAAASASRRARCTSTWRTSTPSSACATGSAPCSGPSSWACCGPQRPPRSYPADHQDPSSTTSSAVAVRAQPAPGRVPQPVVRGERPVLAPRPPASARPSARRGRARAAPARRRGSRPAATGSSRSSRSRSIAR